MRRSNIIGWLCLACACGHGGALLADELMLGGGARLTGSVRSINEAGAVELTSELSPDLLLLKKGSVEKIEFSAKDSAPVPPSTLMELANGDLLHVTLESLDATKITVLSPEVGRLEIPRPALKGLQLGILQRLLVYSGPRNLDEWTNREAPALNWTFEHHCLIANGPATASKKLALPQQFVLRFALRWQARQMPNFQVFFADPLKPKGELCDRYYLQYGGAGLELKREASSGKRFITLVQLNRNPQQYPEHQLQVELRVDRKASRIHLLLNGEREGEFADPSPAAPEGSGLTLVCNSPPGNPQEIRDIEVLEFDGARGRHRAEDRGDPKTDSLISREDDRWSGRLVDIRKTGDGLMFRFKSDFQKDLLEIPVADVSTVFFAATDAKTPAPAAPPFVLRLHGEGSLRVSSCLFRDDSVRAVHPLLGPLQFVRKDVAAMERTAAAMPTTPSEP